MEVLKGLVIVCTNGALRFPRRGLYPSVDNQVIHEDIFGVLSGLKADGWGVFGICNQGGIALGKKSLEDTIGEFMQLLHICPFMDAALFCPSFDSRPTSSGLDLVLLERGDVIPAVTEFGFSNEFSEDGHPIGSDRILLKGYDSFRKPGSGMIQFALNYAGYGAQAAKKGLYNPSTQSHIVNLIKETIGVGDREEDFQAFREATVTALRRNSFVEKYNCPC